MHQTTPAMTLHHLRTNASLARKCYCANDVRLIGGDDSLDERDSHFKKVFRFTCVLSNDREQISGNVKVQLYDTSFTEVVLSDDLQD